MPPRNASLPIRIFIAVSLVLVAVTAVADLMAMRELRASLSRSVSSSLSGLVGRLAEQLDRDLLALKELLRDEARLLEGMSDGEAGDFLARKGSVLKLAFDYGVLVVDASGRVFADSEDRERADFADEEFFQRTFVTGQTLVSEPFHAPSPGSPAVAMVATPLMDPDGRVRAVLAGGLVLGRNRMLENAAGVRASRYGQIGVFTRDGTVIAHSDRGLIMERYENPLPESPPAGGGVTEVLAADGEKALLALSPLRNADWVLAGVFPTLEVYAPIETGFAAAHRWFAVGLAACCVLVWAVARREARDLGLLAREVAGIGREEADSGAARVGTGYRGEAGALASAVNRMLASLEAARRDVDELSARLADAQERERRAIAADLHDSVCQSLALANMRLGGLRKSAPGAADAVAGVQAILERSVAELRSLTFSLSPGILYELGLTAALEWHAGEFSRRFGLPVRVSGEDAPEELGEDAAIFLFRAAGEFMANAAKHASATRIEVTLARDGGDVVLTVADDGKGLIDSGKDGKGLIDSGKDSEGSAGSGKGGFGLRNVRQRARQMGGSAVVENRAEGGARATVRVPVSG